MARLHYAHYIGLAPNVLRFAQLAYIMYLPSLPLSWVLCENSTREVDDAAQRDYSLWPGRGDPQDHERDTDIRCS